MPWRSAGPSIYSEKMEKQKPPACIGGGGITVTGKVPLTESGPNHQNDQHLTFLTPPSVQADTE